MPRVALLALFLILLPSCASRYQGWMSESQHVFQDWIPSEELIDILQQRADGVQTLIAHLSMTVENRHLTKTARMRGFIALNGPDRLRLKGFGFFGMDFFDLVMREDIVELFIAPTGELYRGTRQDALESDFALPVQPEDILTVFSGGAFGSGTIHRKQPDMYVLTLTMDDRKNHGRTQKLWINKSHLHIIKMETFSNGNPEARYLMNDYRLVDDRFIPFALEIQRDADESHIHIRMHSARINEDIDDKAFSVNHNAISNIRHFREIEK